MVSTFPLTIIYLPILKCPDDYDEWMNEWMNVCMYVCMYELLGSLRMVVYNVSDLPHLMWYSPYAGLAQSVERKWFK